MADLTEDEARSKALLWRYDTGELLFHGELGSMAQHYDSGAPVMTVRQAHLQAEAKCHSLPSNGNYQWQGSTGKHVQGTMDARCSMKSLVCTDCDPTFGQLHVPAETDRSKALPALSVQSCMPQCVLQMFSAPLMARCVPVRESST